MREAQGRAVDEGLSVSFQEHDPLWLRQDVVTHTTSKAGCSGLAQRFLVLIISPILIQGCLAKSWRICVRDMTLEKLDN